MGCCISSNKIPPPQTPQSPPPHHRRHFPVPESEPICIADATTLHTTVASMPSPPPPEEETVKEVLSETPIPKPKPTPIAQEVKAPLNEAFVKFEEVKTEVNDADLEISEISQLSEMCSFSESLSTSTTADNRAEEVTSEARRRVDKSPAKVARKRSYSGELAVRRERGVRSPVMKSDPSPDRRNNVPAKPSGQVRTTARRHIAGQTGIRRDSGEISGRSSRSPATSEKLSLVMNGRLGERSTAVAGDNCRKVEESNDDVFPPARESLENPLVSLECFIFL